MVPSPNVRSRMSFLTLDESQVPELTPPCTPIQSSSMAPTFPILQRQSSVKVPDAQVYQPEGHPKQSRIDGEIWPPIFRTEFVRSAKAMIPRDDDVFVCTYPKCGTTWIQHICSQLMNKNYDPDTGKELSMTSPMIERMGAKFADELPSPRLLKSHFNYSNCPKSDKAKYIFCVRNPKDCLTSYYFHNKNFKIYDWEDGKFDIFFDLFVESKLAFGDYFEHLLSWLPHINDSNVLFLKYEDMLEDLETAVKKIGNFLGGRSAEIVNDPEKLKVVVAESRVDAMKKNQNRWFPGSVLRQPIFIRKGVKRDWKNYFSKEQSDVMDARAKSMLKGTIAEYWWRQEMSWDDIPADTLPEIEITPSESDEGFHSDEADDLPPSVSRRNSDASSLLPLLSSRRGSYDSISTMVTGTSIGSSGWGNHSFLNSVSYSLAHIVPFIMVPLMPFIVACCMLHISPFNPHLSVFKSYQNVPKNLVVLFSKK
uniref:Sulfotransferase domain-containing protein n=1 Tax=Panagrolaimus sp. JU765 TaxID=591449 RepID=A0AC34QED8_9BILA